MKHTFILAALLLLLVNAKAQNVGIGTATPTAKLDVKSTSSNVAHFNGAAPMYISLSENDIYRGYIGSYSGISEDVDFSTGAGNTTGSLHLGTQATPRLSIKSNGNVGIGTTNPAHKLHVNNGNFFVESSTGSIQFGYETGNQWQLSSTGGGADLRWITTTDGGTTNSLRHYFSQSGNVGLGSFTSGVLPLARLDVIAAGNTASTNSFMLRNSMLDTIMRVRDDGRIGIGYNGTSYGRTINLGGTGINFYTSNETAFGGAVFPTDTSLILWSNSGANNYLVLQPSWGNTGVGTYTPNAKFHVNGAQLIGSNTTNPATGYELSVRGDIIAESVVQLAYGSWPDYVFADDYKLRSLNEVETYITKHKHLPNIPAAAEIEKNGINLGEMSKKLMEKVEELTLYIIDLNKENLELKERINVIEKKQIK